MTTLGSTRLSLIALWGNIIPPLINNSSCTTTSSPRTVVFSMRTLKNQEKHIDNSIQAIRKFTHCPIQLRQPIIQLEIHEWLLMIESASIVQFFKQTPSWIWTRGPMTTFGPIRHRSPIFAVGSYTKLQLNFSPPKRKQTHRNIRTSKTLPTILLSRDNRSGFECWM